MDLVEISPNADPPVCKIIDYKKFVYDRKKKEKELKAKTAKTVIKEMVLNALRVEKHVSHFNLEEAIELVNELKPKTTYLTHISHQLGKHEEVEKSLPQNIRLAYDGLVVRSE